jgi:hypothetical protein
MDYVDDFQTDLNGWNIMDNPSRLIPINNTKYCDWEGIDCDIDGKVIGFTINEFYLTGHLPSDIYLLSELQHIDFSGTLEHFALFAVRHL